MRYLLFLVTVCLFWACKPEGPTVATTPSGYEYTHHTKNSGPKPQAGEQASFVVDIRNGAEVVNSTRTQGQDARVPIPEAGQPANSISPVVEALMVMSIGDSLTVKQSIDSFPRKPPGFETAEFIYYDLVLKGITSKADLEKEQAEKLAQMKVAKERETAVGEQTRALLTKYKSNALDGLQTTESGLKYHIIKEGSGKQVTNGSTAVVHYYGITTDGNMFDNSFQRGETFPVPVGRGQVIRGWDEGLQLLKEGTQAILFIPGDLGYGAAGRPPSIPSNAELVFYIEVEEAL